MGTGIRPAEDGLLPEYPKVIKVRLAANDSLPNTSP